jgi:hypothetical protein
MRVRNSSITAQGVLSLVAIALMLGYAAHEMQIAPPQSAYAQDRQPSTAATAQTGQTGQAGFDASKPVVFTGTIVQQGASFLLRESAGIVYQLDDPSRAQQFAGLPVKVTGKLDATLKVIRVEKIEEARA